MNFRTLKLRSKMLLSFLSTIFIVMLLTMWFSNRITRQALNQNLESSLTVISNIASKAISAGLEFQDNETIKNAVEAFTHEDLFSYIYVTDKDGREVFAYRKDGLPAISSNETLQNSEQEMFVKRPVESYGKKIGNITIGISLSERNRHLAKARWAILFAALGMILIFAVVTFVLSRNIANPITRLTSIAERLVTGDIDQEVEVNREDEIGQLACSFQQMIQALKHKTDVAGQIANGNLKVEMNDVTNEDVLGQAMLKMKQNLAELIQAILGMHEAQREGDHEYFIDAGKFSGVYRDVANGVNNSVRLHIDNLLMVLNILKAYAEGDFSREMKKMPGKLAILNEQVDQIKNNLQSLIAEILPLTKAAMAGKLDARGDIEKFKGGYREIVMGINKTLDAVISPLDEAGEVLHQMGQGNLRVDMQGNYQGDFDKIRQSLNDSLQKLNSLLSQVAVVVEQVTSGARQVTASSQAVSHGATEQASALEEITSSMMEIASQSKQNAENGAQANQLILVAQNAAESGNTQMEQMLAAMGDINSSSNEISKIIKVIDEIAFQTNLLALNAAVEAARAGVHGKGFAVVAEEVRNLAQRSAKAARETTALIESSVQKAEKGSKIAHQTASALDEIIRGIAKATDLVGEIASASKEQVTGIEQVNGGLRQIDQVTQSNAASAEQSASASEELSSQALSLRKMLNKFELRSQNAAGHFAGGQEEGRLDHGSGNGIFPITGTTGDLTDGDTDVWGEEVAGEYSSPSIQDDEF